MGRPFFISLYLIIEKKLKAVNLNKIANYYRECYKHDYQGFSIDNFLASKVELKLYPPSQEFYENINLFHPVDFAWGRKADQSLQLYSKEKGLYAGLLFIKGSKTILSKKTTVFAPLYIYEVSLIKEKEIYLISLDNPVINPAFLNFFKAHDKSIRITYDNFIQQLPSDPIGFNNMLLIKEQLQKTIPAIDISSIEDFLESSKTENDLLSKYKQRWDINPLALITGIAIGYFPRPVGSRGIIDELDQLSKRKISATLLKELFSKKDSSKAATEKRSIIIPASLSESQKKVFYSLDKNNKTLVIGAPGTGKTFTVSALASELIAEGKSVLIASKNNQAGKVISDMLEKTFGLKDLIIKTARKDYRKNLMRKLTSILNRKIFVHKNLEIASQRKEIEKLESEIDNLYERLHEIEKAEIKWGKFYFDEEVNFFDRFREKWILYQKDRKVPVWKIKKSIDVKKKYQNQRLKKYLKIKYQSFLYTVVDQRRKEFIKLIETLKEEFGNIIHEKFEKLDFGLILKALPLWVCNAKDISTILPLQEGLFDVLIIDEASQCDIASSIPLIYRAKKIVVIGDSKQLTHYSFLSAEQENTLRQENDIDASVPPYRTDSLLDLVNASVNYKDQLVFLNEHYRSLPSIISFPNKEFYNGNLKIMTLLKNESSKDLSMVKVNGSRDGAGKNETEANAIIQKLKDLVNAEKNLPARLSKSIGVISPFTAQVALIKKLIRSRVSLNMRKKHKLLVGTPYHFQGEERDIVLVSCVVDNDIHPSVFSYLNQVPVLNVSITRARIKQLVYCSIDHNKFSDKHLFIRYLQSIENQKPTQPKSTSSYDKFSLEVVKVLESWQLENIMVSYPIGGTKIDLIVNVNDKHYCIDLIGYPGEFEEQFSPAKLRMLDRIKLTIFFIPYSSWYLDREKTVANLQKFLGLAAPESA